MMHVGDMFALKDTGAESPRDLLALIQRIKGQASRVNHVHHFDLPQ